MFTAAETKEFARIMATIPVPQRLAEFHGLTLEYYMLLNENERETLDKCIPSMVDKCFLRKLKKQYEAQEGTRLAASGSAMTQGKIRWRIVLCSDEFLICLLYLYTAIPVNSATAQVGFLSVIPACVVICFSGPCGATLFMFCMSCLTFISFVFPLSSSFTSSSRSFDNCIPYEFMGLHHTTWWLHLLSFFLRNAVNLGG